MCVAFFPSSPFIFIIYIRHKFLQKSVFVLSYSVLVASPHRLTLNEKSKQKDSKTRVRQHLTNFINSAEEWKKASKKEQRCYLELIKSNSYVCLYIARHWHGSQKDDRESREYTKTNTSTKQRKRTTEKKTEKTSSLYTLHNKIKVAFNNQQNLCPIY